LAFRDFNNGAAVWMMAIWIGVGFILQGVAATVLATEVPVERGWYAFVRILTVIAGVVTLVWPISSIVVLAITAGSWLIVIGVTEVGSAVSRNRWRPTLLADSTRCAEAQWRVSAHRDNGDIGYETQTGPEGFENSATVEPWRQLPTIDHTRALRSASINIQRKTIQMITDPFQRKAYDAGFGRASLRS